MHEQCETEAFNLYNRYIYYIYIIFQKFQKFSDKILLSVKYNTFTHIKFELKIYAIFIFFQLQLVQFGLVSKPFELVEILF